MEPGSAGVDGVNSSWDPGGTKEVVGSLSLQGAWQDMASWGAGVVVDVVPGNWATWGAGAALPGSAAQGVEAPMGAAVPDDQNLVPTAVENTLI